MSGVINAAHRAIWQYPLRQAVRYTQAEDEQLLAARAMGVSLEDLAADHQRGVNALGIRLSRLT